MPSTDKNFKKKQPKDTGLGERRGFPIYSINPTLSELKNIRKKSLSPKVISGNKAMLVDENNGEILGEGSVAFIEREEVDSERFVKMYLAGLESMFYLVKAGQTVFKILWLQVQENPNIDRVEINHLIAKDLGIKTSHRTVIRGIKDLLEKDFIYNTTTEGLYFFNAKFIFNGNRIVTAKQYVLKTEAKNLKKK